MSRANISYLLFSYNSFAVTVESKPLPIIGPLPNIASPLSLPDKSVDIDGNAE
jgi:hypothetical protein